MFAIDACIGHDNTRGRRSRDVDLRFDRAFPANRPPILSAIRRESNFFLAADARKHHLQVG